MTLLFLILIIIASVILAFIVLVQNPKGGGLTGNIAGFSTQFMGVKQTTDILEKGTWTFAGIIGVLCLSAAFFISTSGSKVEDKTNKVGTPTQQQQTTPNNGGLNNPVQPNNQPQPQK